jgi:hypothetical protein
MAKSFVICEHDDQGAESFAIITMESQAGPVTRSEGPYTSSALRQRLAGSGMPEAEISSHIDGARANRALPK